MQRITEQEVKQYICDNIPDFHKNRLLSIRKLQLKKILQRKNPYLFKAKNITTADELVKSLLDAYLSSQEETIFGSFLEGLAIFVCERVYGGRPSTAEGIDLEFEKGGVLYLVSIKSGPNWGNSSQIERLKQCFRKAKRIMGNRYPRKRVEAINGCCYGRCAKEQKGEYTKLCGQRFWAFISGVASFYKDIIEPLGYQAKKRNDEFNAEYAKVVNQFTHEFIENFCDPDGTIRWDKVVELNSKARAST